MYIFLHDPYSAGTARRAVFHRKYILTNSAAIGATRKSGTTSNQSSSPSGTVPKNGCKNGMYSTPSINNADDAVANTIHLLENKPMENTE